MSDFVVQPCAVALIRTFELSQTRVVGFRDRWKCVSARCEKPEVLLNKPASASASPAEDRQCYELNIRANKE